MKNWVRKGLLLSGAAISIVAQGEWYYPQMNFELYRLEAMHDDTRRALMGAAHPGELENIQRSCDYRIRCKENEKIEYSTDSIFRETRKDGYLYVWVEGRFRGVAALRSPVKGWEAKTFDGVWRPAAAYPDGERPAHTIDLPQDRNYKGLKKVGDYYDAGKELLAYVEVEADVEPDMYVGESVNEMGEERLDRLEYNRHLVQVADGHWRSEVALALRYIRFKTPVKNVKVVPIGRNMPGRGSFAAENKRYMKMQEVGAHTLRLCATDFLLDGLKRDRLPWGGDLTVSLLADAYVFGDADVARQSLSVLDAYASDVNDIVTYSMWTIISHDLYQLYFGDAGFLKERWWRIKWRIENLISRTDEHGFVVKDLNWVFIDWAGPESATALQAIWVGALDAAARLADRVKDARAADYRALAKKVRDELNRTAWDDASELYLVTPGKRKSGFSRQPNVYAIIFDVANEKQAQGIAKELVRNRLPAVGTPYVYGWELIALKRTGHYKEFYEGLEKVFGAMLDAGATSFWEGFDARQKGDAQYGFYGRKWAKSLCHAWSAWPAFIFVSEVMGVKPTSDGWATYEVKSIPGAEGMRATIPTPKGLITIPNKNK